MVGQGQACRGTAAARPVAAVVARRGRIGRYVTSRFGSRGRAVPGAARIILVCRGAAVVDRQGRLGWLVEGWRVTSGQARRDPAWTAPFGRGMSRQSRRCEFCKGSFWPVRDWQSGQRALRDGPSWLVADGNGSAAMARTGQEGRVLGWRGKAGVARPGTVLHGRQV